MYIFHIFCLYFVLIVTTTFGTQFDFNITKAKFIQFVGGVHNVLVLFYTSQCDLCTSYHPIWKKLMVKFNKDLTNHKTIVGQIDCSKEKDICENEDVHTFPTIHLYKSGLKSKIQLLNEDIFFFNQFLQKNIDFEITLEDLNLIFKEHDEYLDIMKAAIKKNQKLDSNNGINQISDTNRSILNKGKHFVKFYVPWCAHCRNLAPTWAMLGESFHTDNSVLISMINCEYNSLLCQSFQIEAYPTLLWIVDGKVIEKYTGPRTHQDLKAFVNQKKQEDIFQNEKLEKERSEDVLIELTNNDFDRVIKNGFTFVQFWVPWSTHCKTLFSIWIELSKKVFDKAQVASLDCSQYEFICNKYEVNGYPTLIMFKDGVKMLEYDDDHSLLKLTEFVFNYTEGKKIEL